MGREKGHKEGDVAEKQSETDFTRNEVWTTSKAKDNCQNKGGFVVPLARVVIDVRARTLGAEEMAVRL